MNVQVRVQFPLVTLMRNSNWASEKINDIGAQRMLQDIVDALEDSHDNSIQQQEDCYVCILRSNLKQALKTYIGRYDVGD